MEKQNLKINMYNECYYCKHMAEVPGESHIRCNNPVSDMKGDKVGVMNGWFNYPFLFDPVWKTKQCENYESKEVEK